MNMNEPFPGHFGGSLDMQAQIDSSFISSRGDSVLDDAPAWHGALLQRLASCFTSGTGKIHPMTMTYG